MTDNPWRFDCLACRHREFANTLTELPKTCPACGADGWDMSVTGPIAETEIRLRRRAV